MAGGSVLHWFRRDLRLSDNIALNAAISLAKKTNAPLIPLYVLDPALAPDNCSLVRLRFLRESVCNLQSNLLKHGLHLRVTSGFAHEVVPRLARRWSVKTTFWEKEYCPQSRDRDMRVTSNLKSLGIHVNTFPGFLVYDPDKILRHCGGHAPKSMNSMFNLVDRIGDPENPKNFADGETVNLAEDPFVREDRKQNMLRFPSYEELGYEDAKSQWEVFQGGEDAGLQRMDRFLRRKNGFVAAGFSKPKTNPAAFSVRETTVLSPYLALGCVSSRSFHAGLREIEQRYKLQEMRQTTLWGQLMWREHFWLLAYTVKNFHQMRGNVICRQINWRRDKQTTESLERWAQAQTGFPWIDALMTQLHKEGFVHHLGRHSLACFLTRGDLWISWEEGFKVFEKYLVDYDYALNSANWMWLSCSAFFVMYYRVYSPIAFGKKWDKNGDFIRHYLPALKNMPSKYIYEPWKAPILVQKEAGCIIGKDYPKPMVDHTKVSRENIEKMKENYAKGEFGTLEEDRVELKSLEGSEGIYRSNGDSPQRKRRRRQED
ncbi:cryptochrome/photolyase [Gracilaria domingensis]|nr:cryptochrome/photolyase [Gracilaria domingensis]